MVRKEYATEGQLKELFIIMFILFFGSVMLVGINLYRIDNLQKEIASMPHYECWNETVEIFVNKSEIITICTKEGGLLFFNYHYQYEGSNCYYVYGPNEYDAICTDESDVCLVKDIQEVCKIIKLDDSFRDK